MNKINFKIPTGIEEEAKDYIEEVIRQLEESELLQKVDTAALTMLANNYSMFISATKQLHNEGMTIINGQGNVVTHPAVKIAKDAQAQAIVVMKDFGLTVKARVKLPAKVTKEDEDDVISSFIK